MKIKRQRLPGKFIVNRHCLRCCSIEQQRNVDVFIPEQQKQKTNIVPLLASFVVSLDLAALHILQTLFLYSNVVATETQNALFQKLMILPLSNAHEDRAITS